MRIWGNLFILMGFVLLSCSNVYSKHSGDLESASFEFFSTHVTLSYPANFPKAKLTKISEDGIKRFYYDLKSTNYQALIRDLRYFKNTLALNDWLLYKLIFTGVEHIFRHKKLMEKELVSWFLLSEIGFDTRITYLRDQVFVSVYSEDELYEIPLIRDKKRIYANLTSFRNGYAAQTKELFLLNFQPRKNGFPFSFSFKGHTALPKVIVSKELEFSFEGRNYTLFIEVDQTVVQIMEDYPYFSENQYLEVPLSITTHSSLIPQLKQLINGKTKREAVQFLATLTRSSFEYKEDKTFFGKSKPMIADEVLYYPFSDCEDRSALFYQLVKDLLNLPMVAIAFDDHLTIGVASNELEGDFVLFQGRPYYICDPTGPANSTTIGKFPEGYENKAYEIIGYYR